MSTVLVVDDDPTVAEVVARYLEVAGHRVEVAADGETALERSAATEPDLVVLDVMLPDISGLAVCQRLRERTPVSVIMLTARDAETDRIQGLEYGADDYVAKPFSPRELVLRVEAVLRRPAPGASCEDRLTLHDGALSVDTGMHEARLDGQVLALTVREYDLLVFLLAHPREAFTRERLMARVWGWQFGDITTVTVHIHRLREKLETDPAHPARLVTVRGVGYRYDPMEVSA